MTVFNDIGIRISLISIFMNRHISKGRKSYYDVVTFAHFFCSEKGGL